MVAENDLALGRIVEAISQSRFWKETAIFVIEDDAQNGPDHVDAHRSVALVISPCTRAAAPSTARSTPTASMLRTMELILGPAADEPVRRRGHADVRAPSRRSRTSRPSRTGEPRVSTRREERPDRLGRRRLAGA